MIKRSLPDNWRSTMREFLASLGCKIQPSDPMSGADTWQSPHSPIRRASLKRRLFSYGANYVPDHRAPIIWSLWEDDSSLRTLPEKFALSGTNGGGQFVGAFCEFNLQATAKELDFARNLMREWLVNKMPVEEIVTRAREHPIFVTDLSDNRLPQFIPPRRPAP